MPHITLVRQGIPNLLPMLNRPPGIHITDVIGDLALHVWKIYPDNNSGVFEINHDGTFSNPKYHQVHTLTQLGCALEHTIALRYAEHYPNRFTTIDHIKKDGIWVTPDLWDWQPNIVDEIKLTKGSTKNYYPGSKKFRPYEYQLASYCNVLETNIGRLHVCHVNGDYSYKDPPVATSCPCVFCLGCCCHRVKGADPVTCPINKAVGVEAAWCYCGGGAVYNVWQYEWTMNELLANWSLMVSHSRSKLFLERSGKSG